MTHTLRWTQEQLATYDAEQRARAEVNPIPVRVAKRPAEIPTPKKPPKYKNKPVEWNGIKFPSQRQLKHHREFLAQHAAGAIRGVMSEVSIRLPGTTRRVRIDHVIVELDGRIRWYDSKGVTTPKADLQYQQLKQAYGIEVTLL